MVYNGLKIIACVYVLYLYARVDNESHCTQIKSDCGTDTQIISFLTEENGR